MSRLNFPDGFLWGAATSAHQIEGAYAADGKGQSNWDHFEGQAGRIMNGDTGRIACDHYHRWQEDVDLMSRLKLQAYRFSVSWPRVMPSGMAQVNAAGLDFYSGLVDALLEAGIQPFVTLYHWVLPQHLQEKYGGWEHRDTIKRFADYVEIVAARLGDRVEHWITHNEPGVAMEAYLDGDMPPGEVSRKKAYQVAHHILLSHGLAVQALRSASPKKPQVGLTHDIWPVHPASNDPADIAAARMRFDLRWDWYLRPIAFARYPAEALAYLGEDAPEILPGDMELMNQPLDFFGLNYYSRVIQSRDGEIDRIPGSRYTAMDWEIYHPGMYEVLDLLKKYDLGPIYITENGMAWDDEMSKDGRIHDRERIRFLHGQLEQVHRAISDGIDVRGYFAWSLMDNFEWCFGYSKRFGLVHVDFETLKRTAKDSARWYRRVIEGNGLEPLFNPE